MTQGGPAVGYHDGMENQPEPSWSSAFREAAQALASAVSDSSRELAEATERFAQESIQAVEATRERAEEAARTGAGAAQEAQAAAEQARAASGAVQPLVDQAREHIQGQARLAVEQIAAHRTEIAALAARVTDELQHRVDEVVARIDADAAERRQDVDRTSQASAATQAVAERVAAAIGSIDGAVERARQAAGQARTAADHAMKNETSVNVALANAREAAEASGRFAARAEDAGRGAGFEDQAGPLLDRLETDYALLARLIQDLQARIGALPPAQARPPAPSQSLGGPAATGARPELTVVTTREARQDALEPVGREDGESSPAEADSAVAPSPAQPELDPGAAGAQTAPLLSGSVSISLAPVPDFDRLLTLDSALSRVSGVSNVTLADYAGEEVTFRAELEAPVSPSDLAQRFGDVAGVTAEVAAVTPDALALRVA